MDLLLHKTCQDLKKSDLKMASSELRISVSGVAMAPLSFAATLRAAWYPKLPLVRVINQSRT